MIGKLVGNDVIVENSTDANQLYNRGYFGTPQAGNGLKLALIEALYLLELNKLQVMVGERELTSTELIMHITKLQPAFEIKYVVYRDLRQRGYIVKPHVEPFDFRVYPRGGIPKKTPSKFWVAAISERTTFELNTLTAILSRTIGVKKELILGVVDEESDLTYYRVRRVQPKGYLFPSSSTKSIEALLLEDRVLVPGPENARLLHETEFFGNMVGNNLQLSLIEAAYLLEKNVIRVRHAKTGKIVSKRKFTQLATGIQPDFQLRLRVYRNMKSRGIIVKTGFKYGTHFRGYERDPDLTHARYLVHVAVENYKSTWPEISRAIRLAQGVRKELLFGIPSAQEEVDYIELERVRP